LAERVEKRVRGAARSAQQAVAGGREKGVAHEPADTSFAVPPAPSTAPREGWGGLPAPWEPLPTWMTAPYEPSPSVELYPAKVEGTETVSMPAGQSTTLSTTPQCARPERRVDDDSPTTDARPAEHPPESPTQPEPDLETQARQVYAILKRRLAAERRREML
jgi:hypothetical protein